MKWEKIWNVTREVIRVLILAGILPITWASLFPATPPITPFPIPIAPDKPPIIINANPEAATGQLRFGNAGCTATVMYPRRSDGRWEILTAAHCTGGVGSKGSIKLKDGRTIAVTVAVRDQKCDVSWLVTDDATLTELPYAKLAVGDPAVGVSIWHMGYGVDKPGNKETGAVVRGPDSKGQLEMTLSVSSGDSGSGIFRSDNGELIAVVCCTSSMGRPGSMWGGSATSAARLRPSIRVGIEHPIEIFQGDEP